MSDGRFELGNGLTIDAENPETHEKPGICGECGVLYYFGGHFCVEKNKPSKAFKRGMKGYYDGE